MVPWEEGVRQGGEMNKAVMVRNLLDFKTVMDKYEIPFVLIFGTLLGITRNEGFISHDSDCDVACFFHTHDPRSNEPPKVNQLINVKNELRKLGFDVVGKDVTPWNWNTFIRDGEKIEVWWFQRIDDEWIFSNNIRYPAHYFDKLDEVNFIDKKFKVPSNAKEWLELTYGIDWQIPKPKIGSDGYALDLNPKEVKKRREFELLKKVIREVFKEEKNG